MIKFSVIIPVRGVNSFLKETIKYLKNQSFADFEVLIIVDEKVDYDCKDNRFKFVVSGPVDPAVKRNLGAKKAKGKILAFLDDDAYPAADWLKKAYKYFSEKSDKSLSKFLDDPHYALCGPAVTPPNSHLLERVSGYLLESWLVSGNTTYRHIPQKKRFINDYPTVNFFVKKNAFKKVEGFSKGYWPGEDTKLCLDLYKEYHAKFLYDPEIVVYHHRRKLIMPFLKQVSRYGNQRGWFSRVFPATSRTPFYFVPSAFLIFLVGGFTLSSMFPPVQSFYILTLFLYETLLLIESIRVLRKSNGDALVFLLFIFGVFLTHIIYGYSFIIGLLRKPPLQLRKINSGTGDYLGG